MQNRFLLYISDEKLSIFHLIFLKITSVCSNTNISLCDVRDTNNETREIDLILTVRFSTPSLLHIKHSPPYSTEVKERVELHLYSLSGTSWPVAGRLYFLILQDSTYVPELKYS